MRTSARRSEGRNQAAALIDYDNLYAVLHELNTSEKYPDEFASEILHELRRYLRDNDHSRITVARAYADFGALEGDDGQYIQRVLHLDGFDPQFVPMTLQDNTAELALCVEAATLLAERPGLQTFVLVTGNRSYLPLVRHLRSRGAQVLVVAVLPPSPTDAPRHAEEDAFLNALHLLGETSRGHLSARVDPSSITSRDGHSVPSVSPRREYRPLTDPLVRRTVAITEEHFGQYKEVYLTPLLRKLSEVLGEEYDPKSLVSELEEAGAVRLEKRDGQPYDYTVLIMHGDHPDVREIQEEMRSQPSYGASSSSYGSSYSNGSGSRYEDDYGSGGSRHDDEDDYAPRDRYERAAYRADAEADAEDDDYVRAASTDEQPPAAAPDDDAPPADDAPSPTA